jgi:hypothetical protein
MGRLVNGRGNLIAQVERFRELGVEVTKPSAGAAGQPGAGAGRPAD